MSKTKKKLGPVCHWDLADDESEMWETDCGNAFQFTDGGPADNKFRYCCYCGWSLKVHHRRVRADGR